MDRQLGSYYNSVNKIESDEEGSSILWDQDFTSGFKGGCVNQNILSFPPCPPDPDSSVLNPASAVSSLADSFEDYDFSDEVFKYINQMLMEEDMEEKTCMFQDSAALQAAERAFYDVLVEKCPPSPDHCEINHVDPHTESPNECQSGITCSNYQTSINTCSDSVTCSGLNYDHDEHESPAVRSVAVDHVSQSTSHSSFCSSSAAGTVIDGFVDSPLSTLRIHDMFNDSRSAMQFRRGFEEASKLLPRGYGLYLDSGSKLVKEAKQEGKAVEVKVEKKYEIRYPFDGSRGKKNPHSGGLDLEEGRSNKQSAVYTEGTVRSEMFDMVLLCNGGKSESALREALQSGVKKNIQQNSLLKGSSGRKFGGKKQGVKEDVVDLRTLLTLCAQAVAADEQRRANELLKQIRQHSSPNGDGMQRMAHYFADGLEARMAGSGNRSYIAVMIKPTSAAEILKAYHLFLSICPFRKLSNFFANKTIMNAAEKATSLHIVDFGILYGFQWPCFIQRLSSRPGGPPKLRITGIDLPNSGFRPAERVEETGRRLMNYAESFNVPFEFNAIAKKWETIQIEDLKLDKNDVLVVNCQYRFRNLLDETVVLESPRDIVLKLIKKMNPDVYLQGVVNGPCSAPFFVTRFREALFHYSSLFDMLETIVPRDSHERLLIEKQILGWEAINVIACEGAERIERPETYKQWQVRNMRAGFRQLPLNREIMNTAKERVKTCYHKDFVIDKDGRWMLLGWKGRIIFALSSWKPAY